MSRTRGLFSFLKGLEVQQEGNWSSIASSGSEVGKETEQAFWCRNKHMLQKHNWEKLTCNFVIDSHTNIQLALSYCPPGIDGEFVTDFPNWTSDWVKTSALILGDLNYWIKNTKDTEAKAVGPAAARVVQTLSKVLSDSEASVGCKSIMTSNKLVVNCGNFAVLVDIHVLPRGSSKDTSWFSDHEKEKVCMLLKDPVDARVKQYIEARKHHGQLKHKEFTQCSPLFLRGDCFRIAAYFMKRWVNLRCILKQKYRELRVFPDRFVVCASPHEPALTPWIKESIALKENISTETSEYFIRCTETGKGNIPSTTQKQQGILKEIIKKTKISKGNMIKPLAREMLLGSVDSKTEKKNEDQSPLDLPSEAQCSRAAEPLDCIKTSGSSLEPPVSELENNTNRRQLDDASSQQKRHSVEGLKTRLIVRKLPCSSESELPDSKQCQSTTTQQKRTRHFSEENLRFCKKTAFGRDGCIPGDAAIIQKSNVECSMQTLDPKLSRQDLTRTAFKEKLLNWRNMYLPSVLSSSVEQINQNKPLSNSEQCPLIPISSHLKMSCSPTEILLPECKKKIENQPRKLKLQRIKKS